MSLRRRRELAGSQGRAEDGEGKESGGGAAGDEVGARVAGWWILRSVRRWHVR
jgi:hypothetical protein